MKAGDLYIMDLLESYYQNLWSECEYRTISGVTHQGEPCLVLEVRSQQVKFLTSSGKTGWIDKERFYEP